MQSARQIILQSPVLSALISETLQLGKTPSVSSLQCEYCEHEKADGMLDGNLIGPRCRKQVLEFKESRY